MSCKQLSASSRSFVLPCDLVEVYSTTVEDPVSRHVLYPSIADVQRRAKQAISSCEAHIAAIDRQPPLSLEYIQSETMKAHRSICDAESILARVFAFYFSIEQLPSIDVPREMTVTLDECLADVEAIASKLSKPQLYAAPE